MFFIVEGMNLYFLSDFFVKVDVVYYLFGDYVNYVSVDLKSFLFVSVLGIRKLIGVDGMINELRRWLDVCDKKMDRN